MAQTGLLILMGVVVKEEAQAGVAFRERWSPPHAMLGRVRRAQGRIMPIQEGSQLDVATSQSP